jgi:hypothetical protein
MKQCNLLIIIVVVLFSCKLGNDPNNGVKEDFYMDGMIKSRYTLKNGLKEGVVSNYDPKGRLSSTIEYNNDMRNGKLINYSVETKKPELTAYFKNDTQTGPVVQYYKEGMIFRESNYTKGRVNGVIKTFWSNGKLKAENIFKMGKPGIGLKEYENDGQTIIRQPNIVAKVANKSITMSLSDNNYNVEFYLDELEEGKFFKAHSRPLRVDDGKSLVIMSRAVSNITIIAKVKTKFGNTLILTKSINVP